LTGSRRASVLGRASSYGWVGGWVHTIFVFCHNKAYRYHSKASLVHFECVVLYIGIKPDLGAIIGITPGLGASRGFWLNRALSYSR
jgi:hypothetical protein